MVVAIKVRLVRIALFLFCASLGQSCSTLHEVPRQPDWSVFTEAFGAAPAQNMTCYLSGEFFEVGERFSHDFENKGTDLNGTSLNCNHLN